MESNLIYRDVTVALLKDEEYPCENDYDEGFMAALDKAIWIVEKYTASAQSEKRTEEHTETHACDCIERQAAIDAVNEWFRLCAINRTMSNVMSIQDILRQLPSAEPKIVRCCKCGFWDRDTLRHQFNDFRDWNEAECKILAERDPYHEINRYTEADDFCSYAERRTDETD